MMEAEALRIETYAYPDPPERPDPGEGDDTCKHGNVTYGRGDCDECDAEGEIADPETPECGACGGPLGVIGTLGLFVHYECRDCGLAHTKTLKED